MLITTIFLHPGLRSLQLRLGTNGTPKPYFHPVLQFQSPISLYSMRLVQIDNESVLESLSTAILHTRSLRELTIWADADSNLALDILFRGWEDHATLELNILELRGFTSLGQFPNFLWEKIPPTKLRELILEVGSHFDVTECLGFWKAATKAGLRPTVLSTNLGAGGLKEFVDTFSGLEVFNILPSASSRPLEPLAPLIKCLQGQHSATIKVFAIRSQNSIENYTLGPDQVTQLVRGFPEVKEFQFEVANVSEVR
ncbi:uncharacterized protein TRUGW13939_09279 [Talaromyces rugulosus]|uniref:F-box domain-containing protein n=1 Tax=Talaromyces rugulosus TaxID=121627 RepID=A0A7H8RC75_TALRU|nr:uncharacterized protein TRUGW13939_09279 [Talaromyces rugulosus]QKX62123.1 hypothetical protein TRUGW13939_09279 [Talaromyces rugulosus]